MKTSANGLSFLEQNEGVVLHVYRDVSGIPTCDVGHVVLPQDGLTVGDVITQQQCDAFLAHDVAKCEAAINGRVRVPPTQNQFDALVSLTFNIGVGGFLSSTVLRDFNAGLLSDEKRAFELWDKDVERAAQRPEGCDGRHKMTERAARGGPFGVPLRGLRRGRLCQSWRYNLETTRAIPTATASEMKSVVNAPPRSGSTPTQGPFATGPGRRPRRWPLRHRRGASAWRSPSGTGGSSKPGRR